MRRHRKRELYRTFVENRDCPYLHATDPGMMLVSLDVFTTTLFERRTTLASFDLDHSRCRLLFSVF
jgi:hypothetical protein